MHLTGHPFVLTNSAPSSDNAIRPDTAQKRDTQRFLRRSPVVYQALGVVPGLATRYFGSVSTLAAWSSGYLVRTAHSWLVRAYRNKYLWCTDPGDRPAVRLPEVPLVGIGGDLGAIRYWGLAGWSRQFSYRRQWSDTRLVLLSIRSQRASEG